MRKGSMMVRTWRLSHRRRFRRAAAVWADCQSAGRVAPARAAIANRRAGCHPAPHLFTLWGRPSVLVACQGIGKSRTLTDDKRRSSVPLVPGLVGGGFPSADHQIHEAEPGALRMFQFFETRPHTPASSGPSRQKPESTTRRSEIRPPAPCSTCADRRNKARDNR